jgi:thioesterase domain-containing protein/acyl carrier protein
MRPLVMECDGHLEKSMIEHVETSQNVTADDRRLLLAELLKKKATRAAERSLSLGQERLWLMASLDPSGSRYNIGVAYRLVGSFDRTALKRAVGCIAERHEVLRGTFTAGTGQPVQRIGGTGPPVISFSELEDLPAAERSVRAAQIALEEAKRPFDLAQGPLWRVAVLRASDDEHFLILVMHHIVSDAWSFYVFGRELAEFYEAAIAGRPPRLSELPIQYADFGQRQRQSLTGQIYEQQLAYWRNHLEGEVPKLLLPTDRPLSAATNRGAFQTLTIPAAVTSALDQLCRREAATTFMTLLAGFEVLLHQYSGQKDLVVCTPASGRHRAQTKDLIGYFNNILPMRFDLEGDPTFAEVVRRTRRVALDAYKYQDIPFQVIADFPNLKAVSVSRALFSLDIEWPPKLTLAGLASEAWAIRTETADFDLSVSLWQAGDEIHGAIEYRADLFDDDTISRMIGDYRQLLEAVTSDPDLLISSLPVHLKPDADLQPVSGDRATPVYEPPNFPSELRIIKEWEDILGKRPIGLDDDIFELGASSLTVARLSDRLRGLFDVDVPLAAVFQARTVRRIAGLVRNGGVGSAGSALAPIQPDGTFPPLFLCEGIGVYYPLIRHLDKEQPVYALVTEIARNYPRVEDLAASYVSEVRGLQPEGPYYLGGLSFGGIVAFEMAQQLIAAGQEVALLSLFDTPTQWAFTLKPFLGRLIGHLSNVCRFGFRYLGTRIGRRLQALWRTLRSPRNQAPESMTQIIADQDRLRHLLSSTADEYKLYPYPGRITLFVLAERDGMSDSLFDPAIGVIDPQLGWGRLAPGKVDVYEVTGEHTGMFLEPNVQRMAEKLADCLERARAGATK